MRAEQYEVMIRRYIADVFNGHNLTSLDQYWIADLVSHWMGQETLRGLAAWKAGMVDFFAAFPDAAYTLEDLVVTRTAQCGAAPGMRPSVVRGEASLPVATR